MGTIVTTYLVDKMGCENREMTVTTNSVPKNTDRDSHKTKRYSENDFVKLKNIVVTIRL
jgi:Na+/glutamate symporter